MPLKIRQESISGQFLLYLFAVEDLLISAITYRPKVYKGFQPAKQKSSGRSALYRLIKSGLVEIIETDLGKRCRLTPKGKVEVLVLKAKMPTKTKWDGKWRMIIFDIPQNSAKERDQLRRLLLLNNFKKLQGSVYISPNQINREAVAYLKDTGLMKFIRFVRVDELDDDKDLKKQFGL